jgi:hypothetical protein
MSRPFCPVTGKVAYANRADAASVRSVVTSRDKRPHKAQVYHCKHCRAFHIGRVPPSKDKAIRSAAI